MPANFCGLVGAEYPIAAFSHCRDVVASGTRSGGFGVLGAASYSLDQLDQQLTWLDSQCGRRSYGVDLVFPVNYEGDDVAALTAMISPEHIEFVRGLERRFGIPPRTGFDVGSTVRGHVRSRSQWEIARRHNVRLLASALGPAPADVQAQAHQAGNLPSGLVGAPEHVGRHIEAGTDIIGAQGTEAGGHSGEITTMVLVPQVVDAVSPRPVLAVGGIGDGRQVAAALALGAAGVWTGSTWLTTAESDRHPVLKQRLLAASSRDTVRSKCRTGKSGRQLRTPWVEAWDEAGAPAPLPAPLQQMLVRDATISAIEHGVAAALGTPVGLVVGMMTAERSVTCVMDALVAQFMEATSRVCAVAAAGESA